MRCDCTECVTRKMMFSHVAKDEIEKICFIKKHRSFKKGENIYITGDEINDLIYLKSGLVKYYVEFDDGKNHILSIAQPFDSICMLNLFNSNNKSLYHLTALEDSVICYIPKEDLLNIITTNGAFALDFITKFSAMSNRVINELMLINSKNLSGRVAYILLKFAQEIYKNNIFEIPISRKEIAETIGMTTENVIRALSEFRQNRIIRINGKEIEIVDMERLVKVANYG